MSDHLHEDIADEIMEHLDRVTLPAVTEAARLLGITVDELLETTENGNPSLGSREQETVTRYMDTISQCQLSLLTQAVQKALVHINGG